MSTLLRGGEEHSPGLVLRAVLALDFMAFAQFTFGVVRPNALFKPNWHLEALAYKLSQVASGEVKRLIVHPAATQPQIAIRIRRATGLVPWP